MSYTVLARKWRPKNFSELVGQQHVMQALANALDQQRLHHAYLFTGTRGVGKTTIARIFAKALNCEKGISSTPCGECSVCTSINEGRFVDLIEVDAASKTKVEDTRELLENVQYAPVQGRFKVYLIDEVHMLSKSSFNALLKTLEEPPEHVKFLLATTDPHKLPMTVLSRCLQFNLMRLTQAQIKGHLAYILEQENINFEESALALIAKSADGSARDALSVLDQAIAYGAGEVGFESVKTMLGLVDQQFSVDILNALIEQSPNAILDVMTNLSQIGVDYTALNDQLIEVYHQIMMLQVLGSLVESSSIDEQVLQFAAENLSAEKIQSFYQIGLLAKQDMRLAPDIRIAFEMALLRKLAFDPVVAIGEVSNSQVLDKTAKKKISVSSVNNQMTRPNDALNQQQTNEPDASYEKLETADPINNDYFKNLKGKINQTLGKPETVTQVASKPDVTNKNTILTEPIEQPRNEIPKTLNHQLEKKTVEVALDIKGLDWQQIIERLEIKGMEADLANSSILVEHLADSIVLSVDPGKIKVLDLAIKKLEQIFKDKLNYSIRFVESEQQHLTPNKVKLNEQQNQKELAKQSIDQDQQVQHFVEILNMEVIESSIRPKF